MGYDRDLSFVYFGSTKIVFGVGTARDVGMEMAGLGCNRALVVADPGVIKAGLVDGVVKALGDRYAGLWSEVPQDTGVGVVNRAAAFAREKGADCVVSVGGGSVIDTGKGICILLTEGGSLENFEGIQLLTRPQTPHIVIPTTAGTGSEVTCMAVILDERKGQKILIVEYFNTPRIAILDPKMTEKLPPSADGLDRHGRDDPRGRGAPVGAARTDRGRARDAGDPPAPPPPSGLRTERRGPGGARPGAARRDHGGLGLRERDGRPRPCDGPLPRRRLRACRMGSQTEFSFPTSWHSTGKRQRKGMRWRPRRWGSGKRGWMKPPPRGRPLPRWATSSGGSAIRFVFRKRARRRRTWSRRRRSASPTGRSSTTRGW